MGLLWDVFCRVIDNHGDLGVCWRLARQLCDRGERVRLWVDDAAALAWMAPHPRPGGIEIRAWPAEDTGHSPGDVVIEAFGCDLPEPFLARMAQRHPAPRWINLEYLSAESYVERSHGLASPQFRGPAAGLDKRFFYPGFTARTGGLLRETGLLEQAQGFDGAGWLARQGWGPRPGERVVSLFSYPNPRLPDLIQALGERPTLLLVCPGDAQRHLPQQALPAELRWVALPYLSQDDYDRLLWSCDLNFVRGEDSFVRAQWAGKPWVWQIYPQEDGAHGPKLDAFLDLALAGQPTAWSSELRRLWHGWNGLGAWPGTVAALAAPEARNAATRWRADLARQTDLCSQLLRLASVG